MGYFLFDHLVTLYMIQNVEIKNLYKTGQAPWTILKALFVQKVSKHLFVKNVTAGSSTLHSVDSSLNLTIMQDSTQRQISKKKTESAH